MTLEKVSIILPIYNAADFLKDAVESIVRQTHQNLELLIIDDHSTDSSVSIANSYASKDPRVRVISNEQEKGIVGALNTGIDHASGDFVARMDADDIAVSNRLSMQLKFFADNPEVGLCGTWVRTFGAKDPKTWQLPAHHQDIRAQMLFYGAIAHPSVMWRRSAFQKPTIKYDQNFIYAEDYELWTRIAGTAKFANVPSVLLKYRLHENNAGTIRRELQRENTKKVQLREFKKLGIEPSEEEYLLHQRIADFNFENSRDFFEKADQWFKKIQAANQKSEYVDSAALIRFLNSKRSDFEEYRIQLSTRFKLINAYGMTRFRIASKLRPILRKFLPVKIRKILSTLNSLRRKCSHLFWKFRVTAPEAIYSFLRLGTLTQRTVPFRPKIGMAVLAYERPDYLELCLDSLFRSNLYDFDITFLIVDDGSKDPKVREIIEKERDGKYKIKRLFTPKGPNNAGAAINKGVKELMKIGDFDIIGWSDPDALYHPEWLKKTMEICLWAKAHHRWNKLGPFSSFNSSDYIFHQVLGTYRSPYGNYVVKRQMGMLNYFYFKEDFKNLGFFDENPDDETLMTRRFEQLEVRNFCTETSYIEHLGQFSILNQWRPTAVNRAVHGMNPASGDWGPYDLRKLSPYAYYKYHQNYVDSATTSGALPPFSTDLVVVAIAKDLEVLGHTIKSVKENLAHPIGKVFIVSPEDSAIIKFCLDNGHQFVNETTVLPITKKNIEINTDGEDRRGWLFQQLLKLSSDLISPADYVFVIDADTVLTKKQSFIDTEGRTTLLVSDEYHTPYYDTYKRLFGNAPTGLCSFVAHQMMFGSRYLKEFRESLEKLHPGQRWYEVILAYVDYSKSSSFSEYETYGHWISENHPDKIFLKYWNNRSVPRSKIHQIKRVLADHAKDDSLSISFHSYL